MPELAVLVPTRGRPENIHKVISAWDFTNAWDVADLILIVDADDPELPGYQAIQEETRNPDTDEPSINLAYMDQWMPMVHKLNRLVRGAYLLEREYFALGFAGDDHLPRTIGWAQRYLTVLHEMKTGMVYGDDGYQEQKLATEWAVTSDVVRALGRMVPADVEHLYCDNAMMDLFGAARALRHLPEVRIEHMHPITGKVATDDQYQRVNHRDQYKKDRRAYEDWRGSVLMSDQLDKIRHLRKGLPDVTNDPIPVRRNPTGSGPRPVARPGRGRGKEVQRSGPTVRKMPGPTPFPQNFRNVRGATPDEIGIALADFAAQVPADQEIVELGVFQGRTALLMAWGASQGHGAHVTAIDPWDLEGNVYDPPFTDADSRVLARTNVDSLGYADKISLIQAFSHEVASTITAETSRVGLLFVDGDHTREGARRDIESWAPHLAEGARIAVDDYGHPDWPGVGEAVDELVAEGFLEPIEIYHERLAVTRLTGKDGAGVPAADRVTAITGEGVSPSPGTSLTVPGQVAVPDEVDEMFDAPAQSDSEVSNREAISIGEAIQVEGTKPGQSIDRLNLSQLKTLAKVRGIKLGARKDLRASILQALRDGR